MIKKQKEKSKCLTAVHLDLLHTTAEERKSLQRWMKVVDALDKNTPVEKINFPLNDPFVLKGLIAKNPPNIEKSAVNWLMPSDLNPKNSFFAEYLLLPEKTKSWFPKNARGEEKIIKKCTDLITSLLKAGAISSLDLALSTAIYDQKSASLLSLAVLSDAPVSALMYEKSEGILTNVHRLEIARAAIKSVSYNIPESHFRIYCFTETEQVILKSLAGVDFKNVTDPKECLDFFHAISLATRRITKNTKEEKDIEVSRELTEKFMKGFAEIPDKVFNSFLTFDIFTSKAMSSRLLKLAPFLSDTKRQMVVNKWVEAFSEPRPLLVCENYGNEPAVINFPLTNPLFQLTNEQAAVWLEEFGKIAGVSPAQGATFGNIYFSIGEDQSSKFACFSPEACAYIQKVIQTVRKFKDEQSKTEKDRRQRSYGMTASSTTEEKTRDSADHSKKILTLSLLFSAVGALSYFEQSRQPKKKML